MSAIAEVSRHLLAQAKLQGLDLDHTCYEQLANSWYITLPATVALVIFTVVAYRILLHPLSKFPGPFLAKFSGSWRNTRLWRGSWHDDVLELHKVYGSIVRVAPNELSIVDEKALKLLYGHGTKVLKTSWYSTWQGRDEAPGIFQTQNKAEHSFLRKRVSAVYSMSAMLRCEPYIQRLMDLLMERLHKHAAETGVVNMSKWAQYLAFDVVGELAFGEPLGQLETESDNLAMAKNVHQLFFFAANMGHYWGQMDWFRHPLLVKLKQAVGVPNPMAVPVNWTMQRICERRENGKDGAHTRDDMLAHFINMKKADGTSADLQEILAEGMNLVGAGADTTSVGMRTCLYYLCRNPEWYSKVQQEIDEFYKDHNLQQPITYQQTQELRLLCASIREALRLLPSITYPLYRYAPPELEVAGYNIPAGTSVSVSPGAANRDPKVWGNDADEFKPDRWLRDAEEAKYLNANDMTFGGNGARACIGKNLALVELHKFVAQLLRNFDVQFVNPERPWRIHSQWFANQHDMFMTIKARNLVGVPL